MSETTRRGPRQRLAPRGERGQIIVFWLVFILPMTMLMLSVYNVGQLVAEKQELQNAADAAAYSGAVWEARYMNLSAYITRAMIANYDTMASLLSFWSMADAFDGFLELLDFIGEKIPIIGGIINAFTEPAHQALHAVNSGLSTAIGGSEKGKAVLYIMEMYNKGLSFAQQALYFLNQAGRASMVQSIAWAHDPSITYFSWVEALNAYSLNARIRYAGKLDSGGPTSFLKREIHRSLNELSRGESFRDTDNLPFLGTVNTLLAPFDFICSLIGGSVGLTIGGVGYNVQDYNEMTGATPSSTRGPSGFLDTNFKCNFPNDILGLVSIGGESESGCDEEEIVRDDKLFQHDLAGIQINVCVIGFTVGHHSDDSYNVGGGRTVSFGGVTTVNIGTPHIFDDGSGSRGHGYTSMKNFTENGIDCSSPPIGSLVNSKLGSGDDSACEGDLDDACEFDGSGVFGTGGSSIDRPSDTGQLKSECAKSLNEQNCTLTKPTNFLDPDHAADLATWRSDCQKPENVSGPSDRDDILGAAEACQEVLGNVDDTESGIGNQSSGSGSEICQTVYKFDTQLPDMKTTTFVHDEDIAEADRGRRIEGPTVMVYMRKARQLGVVLGYSEANNDGLLPSSVPPLEAYSMAKVYYQQRPNAADPANLQFTAAPSRRESIYNPFWAARLELPQPGGSRALLH